MKKSKGTISIYPPIVPFFVQNFRLTPKRTVPLVPVPRAGEIIYILEELKRISGIYHQLGKQIGCPVAGEAEIRLALEAGIYVLHHAHGITDELVEKASQQCMHIVATPMGGIHLQPNSPKNILTLVEKNIPVSISTDSYLPPFQGTSWLPFQDQTLQGPDVLMLIANPGCSF